MLLLFVCPPHTCSDFLLFLIRLFSCPFTILSALEKELCALKVSFNSGSRELVALRNILRRNEYFPILKQHPVKDREDHTVTGRCSSREKAVITAPNETQKPFFESKETLPVGQLSIFDYM